MLTDAQPSETDLADVEDAPQLVEVPNPVISTEHLSKRMRGAFVLRNVSMRVMPGEIYGLIGMSGAGKSTLVRLLLGFLRPDGGNISLFGEENLTRERARIGYLPEKARYHGNFTGRDYLRFHAELSGLKGGEARRVADRVAETVGLGDSARKLIGGYSKPVRQRLGLAVALLAGGADLPELLVLDEPATGFGDEIGLIFREVVLDCKARGSTVFLCSRELTPVERACTSVGILRSGRLLAQTHIEDSPRTHLVGMARDGATAILPHLTRYLENLHPSVLVRGGVKEGEPLHVSLPAGPDVPYTVAMKAAALRAMVDARWDIVSVYSENRDLESLFLQAVPMSEPKAVKPAAEDVAAPVLEVTPDATADAAPEAEEQPDIEAAHEDATTVSPPITGLLAPMEAAETRSPATGPLGNLEPGDAVSGGNGMEVAGSSGPSTAPLLALDADAATNGYETALPPLPVRAVSGGKRAVGAEAGEERVSGNGE